MRVAPARQFPARLPLLHNFPAEWMRRSESLRSARAAGLKKASRINLLEKNFWKEFYS